MEGELILRKAYSDYIDKFLGYEDVPTFEEFKIEVINGGPLSYFMSIKVSKRDLTMEERWKLFDKLGFVRNLDFIDWVPSKITTLTYQRESGEII
jgi:hypothetical protein